MLRIKEVGMNKKLWEVWFATRQWFSKLFTSEADALLDDFENNPPPKIGPQPYKDKPELNRKWR